MELNIETKQQLEKLLAKPALVAQEHIPLLQDLIKAYPYYQPLYLLLAKADIGTENQHTNLTKAALYNNGGILHKVIHEPKKLIVLEDVQIVNYTAWSTNSEVIIEEVNDIVELSPIKTEVSDTPEKSTQPSTENAEPLKEEFVVRDEQPANIPTNSQEDLTETKQEKEPNVVNHQTFVAPEIENLAPLQNEIIAWEEETTISTLTEEKSTADIKVEESLGSKKPDFIVPEIENLEPLPNEVIKVCGIEKTPIDDSENDEQETFEEIGEVVVPTDFTTLETEKEIQEESAPEIEVFEEEIAELSKEEDIPKQEIELSEEQKTIDEVPTNEAEPNSTDETSDDDLVVESVLESIASTDFFAFEKNFNAEIISEEDSPQQEIKPLEKSVYHTTENIVSKYDDDKLPFTFLWWLTKTRKDHEQIFRPFVSPVKTVTPTADLQQQYVEHIFHIQSPLDTSIENEQIVAERELSRTFSKEDELIENFIKNEPQIKVPKPDQINNENKAKKSSEDNYDLVSETLAEIYIEQMLYHKAIDTYRKLSLKFPEKSRYFADLVQSLEKKI